MSDAHDDQPPSPDPPPDPAPLDYFAAHAPGDAPTRPGFSVGWIILALGWVPFICGIINSQATIRSGVQDIIDAHRNAAILFTALGLLAIIASLGLFVRQRDALGFLAAIISLTLAGGIATCLIFLG